MMKEQLKLLLMVSTSLLPSATSLNLDLDRSGLWLIPEDTNNSLSLSLNFNYSNPLDIALIASESRVSIMILPDEEWKLDFVNNTVEFSVGDITEGHSNNKSILLSGYYWGRTKLSFYLFYDQLHSQYHGSQSNGTLLRDDITVGVKRAFSVVDNIFMTVGTTFILINTINMGCELDLQIIWECIRKPLGPICGFISQFGIMPPLSYLTGYLLFKDALFRLGLFTLGCSPGGLMSNFWTLMFNGDLNLSITMTFISTIAALGMMPLWIFTLGKSIIGNDKNLKIPFSNLVISLFTLTLPLAIGILIQYKRPKWAAKLSKCIKPFTFGILIFFFTVGIYNSYKLFVLMTLEMYIAGLIVAFSGFLFGAIFATAWCFKKERIIAISIETALQNTGTAYIVLKLSLPSPDGDLASLPLMAQAMQTGIGLLIGYLAFIIAKRLCRSSLKDDKEKMDITLDFNDREKVDMDIGFHKEIDLEIEFDDTQNIDKSINSNDTEDKISKSEFVDGDGKTLLIDDSEDVTNCSQNKFHLCFSRNVELK